MDPGRLGIVRGNARVRFCIIEQKCGHEVGCPPRLVQYASGGVAAFIDAQPAPTKIPTHAWGPVRGCPPSFSCVGEGFDVPSPASKDDGMIQPTDAVVLSAKGVGDIPWHVWSPLAESARCEIQRERVVAGALV